MRKKKQASHTVNPTNGMQTTIPPALAKKFRANTIESPNKIDSMKIGWNFSRMDTKGCFRCSLQLLHDYHDKLVKIEGKTKSELLQGNHNHPLALSKISRVAQARVTELRIEDETIYQLNIGTPARLWGIWEHNIFHILWLDPEHKVYLCKKPS